MPVGWGIGIFLGIALNYLGILKIIDLLKNENTRYIFQERFLIPDPNKKKTDKY